MTKIFKIIGIFDYNKIYFQLFPELKYKILENNVKQKYSFYKYFINIKEFEYRNETKNEKYDEKLEKTINRYLDQNWNIEVKFILNSEVSWKFFQNVKRALKLWHEQTCFTCMRNLPLLSKDLDTSSYKSSIEFQNLQTFLLVTQSIIALVLLHLPLILPRVIYYN